ncbi:V-type proton ATPase subunit G 1-like [Lampetra fluviatilis]
MASQSHGIQQLLQAEKRAAEKVSEARKRKNQRLKLAKKEAQAEIDEYKTKREEEFAQRRDAALGSQGDVSARVDEDTDRRLLAMKDGFGDRRDAVLASLLALVCDVHPQIHENYRIDTA